MKKCFSIISSLLALCIFNACEREFLDGSLDDQPSVDQFFNSAEQVQAATASMYGFTWYYFNSKFNIGMGDVYAGNSYCDYSDAIQFKNFAVTQNNQFASEGWGSLYVTIANANSIIKNVPAKSKGVSQQVINTAVAEARFIRATAYFYLVRVWGPVPIITDASALLSDYKVNRIVENDVYRFIVEDLQFAEDNLPVTPTNKGRVGRGAAKGMLAKVYLQMKEYDKAKAKAAEVISNESAYGYGLMDNYTDLFFTSKENNKESLFALQWVACQNYGTGNENQAYFAPYGQGLTGFSDGWGTFVPSIDIQNEFEANDKRIKPSMFVTNAVYPELKSASGGYTYDLAASQSSRTRTNIKKYVVGLPADDGGQGGCNQSYPINTYMLRYADVLLIYAEAVLGSNSTTSDAGALMAFNRVRQRAGLGTKNSLTIDDILHERRCEFAFEGQYWYDLLRLNRSKAKQMIAAQERGVYSSSGITSYHASPTDNSFLLPLPQTETDRNPRLLDAPVNYY